DRRSYKQLLSSILLTYANFLLLRANLHSQPGCGGGQRRANAATAAIAPKIEPHYAKEHREKDNATAPRSDPRDQDELAAALDLVPSPVVLEFGDAISGISRVPGQAARSIG